MGGDPDVNPTPVARMPTLQLMLEAGEYAALRRDLARTGSGPLDAAHRARHRALLNELDRRSWRQAEDAKTEHA
jgi:hypothetical protein